MTSWASVFIRRTVASVVFVWAMSAASASANPILSINPSTTTVNAGDTFTLDIQIDGVVDLFSYNFDLQFDSGILSFVGILDGGFIPPGEIDLFVPGDEWTEGTVSFTGNSVYGDGAGVNGNGTLAVATFVAIMAGETWITFPDQFPNQLLFSDSNFDPSDPNSTPGQISFSAIHPGFVQVNGVTSAVPEAPSTMILLVAALALAACRCFTRAL